MSENVDLLAALFPSKKCKDSVFIGSLAHSTKRGSHNSLESEHLFSNKKCKCEVCPLFKEMEMATAVLTEVWMATSTLKSMGMATTRSKEMWMPVPLYYDLSVSFYLSIWVYIYTQREGESGVFLQRWEWPPLS